jgi:hypothetical protein
MSHYSRVKTIMKDKDTLLQCLTELGYEVKIYQKSRQYQLPNNAKMSILINERRVVFALNADNSYDMIADWDLIGNEVQKKFTASLLQRYALTTIIAQTNQQGFNVVEHTKEEDGGIRIVVRRWV